MKAQLVGEQCRLVPFEFVYRVPLPGPDVMEAERALRLYPDQEYPRYSSKIGASPMLVEERADVEVRWSDEGGRYRVQVVALPGKYTQSRSERVLSEAIARVPGTTRHARPGEYKQRISEEMIRGLRR